jgi:hypothetical protein
MHPTAVRHQIGMLLDSIGIDSYDARQDRNCWRIQCGSAIGEINLVMDSEDLEASLVCVRYRIMRVPLGAALPFYRRLLELNDSFVGVKSFTVDGNNLVWLTAGRMMRGMDKGELAELVTRTSHYADHYDDVLLDEFGRDCAVTGE